MHAQLSPTTTTLELLHKAAPKPPIHTSLKTLHLPCLAPHKVTMASLAILLLLMRLSSAIATSSNYISRSTEQQIIATVAPAVAADADGQSAQPFLTSPSRSYAAYLRRAVDSSGGPGGDMCFVQIQRAYGGNSVWESDCTPVGGADTCDLAFSPMGLELFAGGHSLWDTGIDAEPGTLSLDDGGDMRIVSKDGVTVWKASGEPWTGQQCGAAMPVSSSPSTAVLPPLSTTSAKLLTPPAATIAGPGSSDFTFGDPPAPPVDTSPDQPLPPPPADASPDSPDLSLPPTPADALPGSPDLPLSPPPAASPDSPDLSLPPTPADALPGSPDLPLSPPPADTYPVSPDQPLYSSPPPAPTSFSPQPPMPPLDTPPLAPPTGTGETSPDTPLPGILTPPVSPGDMAFPPAPVGMPHPHGPPHQLPFGASPPVPDALAPSGHGAGAGLPFGHGQQQGQGVFGQQQQLSNGAGHPLEDSAGGWSRSERGRVAVTVSLGLAGLVALAFCF